MKQISAISFQDSLAHPTLELLQQEQMECLITQKGIPELISELLYYKEEGKSLYPDIYIFDDLELIKGVIGRAQTVFIGKGEKNKETMLKALKKCAPLTENGWSIYILRTEKEFEYGLIRGGVSILSESVSDLLVEQPSEGLHVILLHQIAEKLLEVKGVQANTLLISYGNKESLTTSPLDLQKAFVEAIIKMVKPELQEQSRTFFKKVFLEVLRKGHGTLACIISANEDVPNLLADGIALDDRIDVPETIEKFNTVTDLSTNAELEGQFSLIVGMMQSDGITVFTNTGQVACYNVFVKHPQNITNNKTSGGARSRTYLTLEEQVGKDLQGAYIQSQDGKIKYNHV